MNHGLVKKRRASWRLFILVLGALIATLFLFSLLPQISLGAIGDGEFGCRLE